MTLDATLAAVLGILFAAVLVQATLGFGNALVSMSLLTLVVPVEVATPLVALVATSVSVTIIARDWRQVDFRAGRWVLAFSLLGVPLGVTWIKQAPEALLKLFLGCLVSGFALLATFAPRFRLRDDRWAPAFGFVAGVLGGAYNTGGPPVVMYGTFRGWPRDRFRATLQGYFLVLGLFTATAHALTDLWTPTVLGYYLAALPVALAASLLGGRCSGRIPHDRFRQVICGVLVLLGLLLVAQSLRALW